MCAPLGTEVDMNKGKWIIAAAAALALGVLTLPVFLTGGGDDSHELAASNGVPSAASCKAEGPANLSLTLKDMNDADYRLADLKGKVVLVNFWASWCAPCLAEIPEFIKVREEYHDKGFEIIGISTDDNAAQLRDFAKKYKTNYPLLQVTGEAEDAYGPVFGLPTSVIVARDGSVCKRHFGPLSKEQLEKEIKSLL
jgi:thiol-disulfide isomerase/thioredoxin